jgi:ABC-2 type transport system permease protein
MQPFLTLVRRELGMCYVSLIGYVIVAAIQFLLGLSFVIVLRALVNKPFDVPVTEAFFNNGLFWLVMLLAPPIITMRTFAQEKSSGTYETLMTTPVGDAQVVLAKFTGALCFFMSAWLPLLAYPFLLKRFSVDLSQVDTGALGGTFLGIFLFGSLYIALGCFASSLTRNQIIAAMNAFVIGLGLFLLGYLTHILPPKPGWQSAVLQHVSMIEHMKDFTRGMVDTRQVVFYLSLTALFLFLTLKVVESRRWK